MAHLSRISQADLRPDVRHAGVLILLYQKLVEWHLVLIRRKSIAGDIHSGQISFPGGRARMGESPEAAALRESHEEIGSPSAEILTLGQLTSLHVPVSNHLVFPVVAYLQSPVAWRLQHTEVESILEVPVDTFLAPETQGLSAIQLRDGLTLPAVPCYRVESHLIWGATAMILSEFVEVIKMT